MKFVQKFKTQIAKIEGLSHNSSPPSFWTHSGNYVLNRILTGSFRRAFGQGRVFGLVGPSGSGKSFLISNAIREAQKQINAFAYVIDSENALDEEFVGKIGVDVTEDNYLYTGVITIPHVKKVTSDFVKMYKESGETRPVIMVIDSLGMLLTDSEFDQLEKGEAKGDQGQRSKQIKALLKGLVQSVKDLPFIVIVTDQVYQATQDNILNGTADGNWVVNGAMKFSLSNLTLLTKAKLKDEKEKSNILGINMKCEAIKTRFTKPFQKVIIQVPYETGMDPYSGLLDVAQELGVVTRGGSWYTIAATGDKFQSSNFEKYAELVIDECEKLSDVAIGEHISEEDEVVEGSEKSLKSKRLANYVQFMDNNPDYKPEGSFDQAELD